MMMAESNQSSDFLTPLCPERLDLLPSDFDRVLANDWLSSGSPGLDDVDGAARMVEEYVALSDITPVTVVGRRVCQ